MSLPPRPAPAHPPSIRGPSAILVVEDDERLGSVMAQHLASLGRPVSRVATGKQAIEHLAKQPDSLMLLDYALPDMSGQTLIETLAKTGPPPPFIVVTGYGSESLAVEMMKLGARDYLIKNSLLFERLLDVFNRVFRELEHESALAASEQRFQAVFEASDDALLLSDGLCMLDCNARALEIFGLAAKSELLGKHPADLSPPTQPDGRDSRTIADERMSVVLGGSVQRFEWMHRRGDGTDLPTEVVLSPLSLGGRPMLLGTVRDITDRLRASDKLRQSEERHRRLFHDATEGIAVADPETGEILDCNQAFSTLTGYAREEILGMPQRRLHPSSTVAGLFSETFTQHRGVRQGEILATRLVRKSGEELDVEIKASLVQVGSRRLLQAFFRDISVELRFRHERETTVRLLELLNDPGNSHELVQSLTQFLQAWTGVEAVGIRLREGDDFPYFETNGFSADFVASESSLCARMPDGCVLRDKLGQPLLECMCGNVLRGRVDPARPFFTARGSFWTNSTSLLLADTTSAERLARTRNRCHGEGYESVALVPLRHAGKIIGLIQLNDRRRDRFTPELIRFLEGTADQIALALVQRQNQADLRESESRYRLIADHTVDVIWLYDLALEKFVFVSPSVERVAGFAPAEIVGRGLRDVLPENTYARVSQTLAARLAAFAAGDEPMRQYTSELELRRKDGTTIVTEVVSKLVTDDSGRVTHLQGVSRDISARKAEEEKLRQAHARFQALFESARDAIFVADIETERILDANSEACRLVGRGKDALIGMHQSELHPVESREAYRARFQESLKEIRTEPHEGQVLTADGRIVPVEISASVVEIGTGRRALQGIFRNTTERRRDEAALRERQARLDSIFRAAPVGIGVVTNRVLTAVNEQVCLMTGYEMEELVGMNSRLLYPTQEEYEEVGRDKYRMIEESGTGTVESRWRRKDGSVFDVMISSTPIVAGDLAQGVTFTALDISDRKRADAEIRLRNRMLEGMQRISTLITHEGAHEDALDRVAAEIHAMSGFRFVTIAVHDPATDTLQPVGHHGYDMAPALPRTVFEHESLSGSVFTSGRTLVIEDSARSRDRLKLFFPAAAPEVYVGVPIVQEGRTTGVMALADTEPRPCDPSSISQLESVADHLAALFERRKAEQHAQERAALLDVAQDAILVRDFADRVVYWNHGAAHLYGWSAAEAMSQPFSALLAPDSLPNLASIEAAVRDRGEWSAEMVHRTRQGRLVPVQSRWSLVRDKAGRPASALIVNTDLTETRRLTTQLLRAQRLESIGTLASGIAHDLNNVLSPIVMSLSMLRERALDDTTATLVETIGDCARRGAGIIRQLLTFARGVAGERVDAQPKHVVAEIARIARETFPRSIDVTVDFCRDPWCFRGDVTQIQQVLMNLCVNARDAMPAGGSLALAVSNTTLGEGDTGIHPRAKAGPYTVISVTDTGEGISAENLDKIFDPFFTTKPLGQGTGLGLAVSLGIVDNHGGFMHVTSEVGFGSTFRVYLPALRGVGESGGRPAASLALPHGRGEKLLLVDDEPAVREVIGSMLRRSGYEVVVARDGAEALAIYRQQAPSIAAVLTDLMMPGVDGLTLIRQLRAGYAEARILVMTGLGEEGLIREVVETGVRQVLEKPFTTEQILSALESELTNLRH